MACFHGEDVHWYGEVHISAEKMYIQASIDCAGVIFLAKFSIFICTQLTRVHEKIQLCLEEKIYLFCC